MATTMHWLAEKEIYKKEVKMISLEPEIIEKIMSKILKGLPIPVKELLKHE
jgi:hypothetical protein